jgi:ribosome biogenesis GTPase
MRLDDLGWNQFFARHFAVTSDKQQVPGRVVEESKGLYRVCAEAGDYLAQVTGRIRYLAEDRTDYPAVGDWVVLELRPQESRATIAGILPRKTILLRKAAGRAMQEQILGTNLDLVFIVASLNQELNLRRIERYLAMVWESGARPVILLNKADLCSDPAARVTELERIAPGAAVLSLSAVTGNGIERVRHYLAAGQTAALIGSSGVGKSTIINALSAPAAQRVQPVRAADDRGRHTTTSRQLLLLSGGAIVIDTPGMRELQPWESIEGVAQAFEEIDVLAGQCRFRDCRHQREPGCAVAHAVEDGRLTPERLENFRKLQAELRFQERKVSVAARQEDKARWKQIHRELRQRQKKH